eukprot:1394212-Amorphochlora_amoeboformis.AAC.1
MRPLPSNLPSLRLPSEKPSKPAAQARQDIRHKVQNGATPLMPHEEAHAGYNIEEVAYDDQPRHRAADIRCRRCTCLGYGYCT